MRAESKLGRLLESLHEMLAETLTGFGPPNPAASGTVGGIENAPTEDSRMAWSGAEVIGEKVRMQSLPAYAVYWRGLPQPNGGEQLWQAKIQASIELFVPKLETSDPEPIPRAQIFAADAEDRIRNALNRKWRQRLGLRSIKPVASSSGVIDENSVLRFRFDYELVVI